MPTAHQFRSCVNALRHQQAPRLAVPRSAEKMAGSGRKWPGKQNFFNTRAGAMGNFKPPSSQLRSCVDALRDLQAHWPAVSRSAEKMAGSGRKWPGKQNFFDTRAGAMGKSKPPLSQLQSRVTPSGTCKHIGRPSPGAPKKWPEVAGSGRENRISLTLGQEQWVNPSHHRANSGAASTPSGVS